MRPLPRLTQRVHFSCGHRYGIANWTEAENRAVFGSDYSPDGMGHNYALEATFLAEEDEASQLACLPEALESHLKDVVSRFDHKFLNELEEFYKQVPSTENIAQELVKKVQDSPNLPPTLRMERVQLVESETLRVRAFANEKRLILGRTYRVSALHRHHNPELSQEENKKLFHKCSHIHGHDYRVEVWLIGEADAQTGLLFSRDALDHAVHESVVKPFHQKYINDLLGNTSGEVIAQAFYERLRDRLGANHLLTVVIRETRKNSFAVASSTHPQKLVWEAL